MPSPRATRSDGRLRPGRREGAGRIAQHLIDGAFANSTGDWQRVAGAGIRTRADRCLSPERQARPFDADGAHVRPHVSELGTPDDEVPPA
jgi:deoxyribodipyrimidine photolyase